MAFYGYCVLVLVGMICLIGTPHPTKLVIEDFNNEYVLVGYLRILQALAADLHERGELDLSECYIDGTFIVAKKGGTKLERLSKAEGQRYEESHGNNIR
jgi:hypothetical protein